MRGDTQEFTLSSGADKRFQGKANYLYVNNATGLVRIELFRERSVVEEHTVGEQFTLKGRDFDEFRVIDLSGANNTVRILFGPGDFDAPADRATVTVDDSTPISMSLDGGSVTLNQQSISNGATSVADQSVGATSTAAVVAASTDNVRVRVTNPATNTNTMRVGLHSGVGATNGTPLPPGAVYETETQAGVWVYNPGAGAESVAVEVETRT